MEVSLVVRSHKLQYDPPLEELRLQHLTTHLQPFLSLPLRMKGVSSLSERSGFFGAIAHAYPAASAKVRRIAIFLHKTSRTIRYIQSITSAKETRANPGSLSAADVARPGLGGRLLLFVCVLFSWCSTFHGFRA